MAFLDARDGRTELEGKEASADAALNSHVSYGVEESGSGEGYSAGNETQPGPTIMQKVKEKVSDYENHLKGKESTNKEDPHPKLAYIPPRDGKGEGVADLQEEKQHRGASTAALGNDVPAKVTRDYISSVKHEKSGDGRTASSGTFTLMSYNVLLDLYATSEQYSYCPPWTLAWTYQRQNLLREIVAYKANILCLQEVQSDHYEDFYAPELDKHGYTGVYKKKTGENCMVAGIAG